MPKRGRRGCGSISRHKRGDKLKKSSTTHLHPTSVLYVPGQDETTAEQPRGNGQGQDKKIKVSNLVRTNKRLKEANSELASEKKHAEKRAAASEAGQAKERKKIKLLDEEKAASLSREKDTEASLQKKIDENKIQSKAILRDSGKRAAVVMEKEKLNLQNKNKKLKKELAGVKAGLVEQNRRHEAEKAKLRDKLSKQIATLKGEIVILKNKMQRSNCPSITGRQSVEDTEVEESEAEESSGGPSKIQPRLVKRLKAAEILAPRKMIASKIEASVWSEAEPSIKRMARQNDAHDLGAMIFSISRGNAKRAADAVFRWLQKEENRRCYLPPPPTSIRGHSSR